MNEITFLKNQIVDLNDENTHLKSELSFLKGKVDVYERFLRMKGFIKGDEE